MSSWAKPGVKCVCVDDHWSAGSWYGDEILPVRRHAYTVRDVVLMGDGFHCIRLVEIVNTPRDYQQGIVEGAFETRRFRPLTTKEQDLALFRHLLSPSPADVGLIPAGVELVE